jgi:hypothetical protein
LIKTTNIKAYEKFLKAWEYYWRRTEADILQARKLAEETIELDPEYGDAYLLLGRTNLDDIWFYRTKSREKSLETAEQFAQKAISLSADEAAGHRLLASIYMLMYENNYSGPNLAKMGAQVLPWDFTYHIREIPIISG